VSLVAAGRTSSPDCSCVPEKAYLGRHVRALEQVINIVNNILYNRQNIDMMMIMRTVSLSGDMTTGCYRTCKASVKSSLLRNQHPAFYRLDALSVAQSTVSQH